MMADHGPRLEDSALARDPRPPPEVDVFEVREVVVVEAAEGEIAIAARDHVAAAGEQQRVARLRLRTGAGRIAEAVLEGVAVEGHRAADEVDRLTVHAHDLAA